MAKIRNSGMKNLHGDGNVKIFTDNNGKEYTISNTGMKNLHGDGYVQKVKERGSSDYIGACNPILWTIICIFGILYLINTLKWDNSLIDTITYIVVPVAALIDVILGLFTIGK